MKVCLLNDSFPPVIDGVVNVVMNYAHCLQRDRGAEVLVGTPRYPDTDYSVYPYLVVPYSSFNTASVTNGYRAGNPFKEKAVSEMAHFQPDIIHTHCPASSTFDTNGLVVREAAACGLASVLVSSSCAAEGITDGRNGFLIDETPEALAAKLRTLCGNRDFLKTAGLHAMNEIYASWETCVGEAYERYQYILDELAAGRLAPRKKEISDYLVEVTARGMEHRDRLRLVGKELLHDVCETASGMMENFS